MRTRLRIVGGILAGFGIALAGVAALAFGGVIPLEIDFFGLNLNTLAERIAWIGAWSLVAVLGLALLVMARPGASSLRR
ncbi:MAG: hypothetical protein RIB58_08490 [Phycisphaerales bacterium]